MSAPPEIASLVERFDQQLEAYQSGRYNETQLRREFIDPMFKALGWDMENISGYAEAYKDVIHEDAIKIGGATKAPDYCFRIGGTRKFFLETKKPSVDIKTDAHPAFQLRRYAWSAKLPLSILTDFEEFAVYDCRVEPRLTDKATVARVLYLTFHEYGSRWDDIAKIFARDSILKGSFDKFAESTKAKRGTAEVDDAFLGEIEQWRADLARNLAMRNPKLSQRDLNFSIQRTIDRIVFLRICEDRRIEVYGRLQALLNGEHTYRRLNHLFREADERYNSGLFHFQKEKDRVEPPDDLTPHLEIDDAVLKKIIRRLYYPESPYEFSVLPADILGQVYEQFLGKVIRLTEGHQAKVEDKPEVKKAGGVYYTPTYIVDYIVQNTVGKLLGGTTSVSSGPIHPGGTTSVSFTKSHGRDRARPSKEMTPKQAAKLRILDPACGSGSFLIGAYQYLLDWHRDWYANDEPKKWAAGKKPAIYQGPGGEWKLTTAERKRILLQNIFGVDIDAQAVETTKLSLLLKVLEGESEQTLATQLRFYHERALPDLGSNIKCGNSLIGPDFYQQSEMLFLDEEARYRINVFDWNAEFPEIMKAGGFDAVIGNPPYVRIQGFPREQIAYLTNKYDSATGNCDLYVSFIEQGYELLRPNGRFGMIVPNKFFRTDYGIGLRNLLATNRATQKIVDFGANQVFCATTYTCLLFLSKRRNTNLEYVQSNASAEALNSRDFRNVNADTLTERAWSFAAQDVSRLLEKLARKTIRLLDLPAEMSRGSSTGDDEVFMVARRDKLLEQAILRTPIFATDFSRFRFAPSGEWQVIFPYIRDGDRFRLLEQEELKTRFPKALSYLRAHEAALKRRKQFSVWFGYSAPRNLELHDRAQIIVPLLANRGSFVLIPKETRQKLCPMASGGFTITIDSACSLKPEYILGVLNSKLLFWKLRELSNVFRGGWITCTKQYFGELPIRALDLSDPADKDRHDQMVSLVERMLELHKELAASKTEHAQTNLQRQIDATDAQIDQLVYELYGLSAGEIKIVEDGTK
jgi:hypothetical protein